MNLVKKLIIVAGILVIVVTGFLFYFRSQIYTSHGSATTDKIFEIVKGEGNAVIGQNLETAGLISGKWYFYYYIRTHGMLNKFLPGKYMLNGTMTIPEIVVVLTQQKNEFIKITFPEGWTMNQMADRLTANGFPGKEFLAVAKQPPVELVQKFDFLTELPKNQNLEGFLFPDTYFFSKEATGNGIAQKMLNNFGEKVTPELRQEILKQKKNIFQIVTMASIIEGEVRTEADRKIVSGLFWDRIGNNQRLQSCATIAFVLGEKKKQYSFDDTRTPSPYNTYLNNGLIPGPISNPGLVSIRAAVYPAVSGYQYFLSDPETGQTIFSKTIEEHNANKVKYGL